MQTTLKPVGKTKGTSIENMGEDGKPMEKLWEKRGESMENMIKHGKLMCKIHGAFTGYIYHAEF